MRKVLFAALLLVVGACATSGGTAGSTSSTAIGTSSTDADSPETTALSGPTSSIAPGETATTSDRQKAPDFTLELGDGGTYTLSEGEKPVYMVFWAEW